LLGEDDRACTMASFFSSNKGPRKSRIPSAHTNNTTNNKKEDTKELGRFGKEEFKKSMSPASQPPSGMASFFGGGGGGGGPETASRLMYLAITRNNLGSDDTATVAEFFVRPAPPTVLKLGRTMVKRSPTPGWDDINSAGWRAIKLPIHDLGGCTGFVAVFGGTFDPKRAQATTERLALLLGPMIDQQVEARKAASTSAAMGAAEDAQALALANAQVQESDYAALVPVMTPVLERELAHANSLGKVQEVQDQIESVRRIMEQNVEMMLDRQELLGSLEAKTSDLQEMAGIVRQKARRLRRWHLMNQVKWGVAIGTLVTASVAIPIAVIAAA